MKNKIILFTFTNFLLVFIDQITKTYLVNYLKTQNGMLLSPTSWLDIVYAWNYGISFGLFGSYRQYSNYVFLILNILIIFYLSYLYFKSNSLAQSVAYSFIIGGALGNIIDRIFRGAVFDFIYFHYEQYSFPAFNFADLFINVGVVIMVFHYILTSKSNQSNK